MNTARKIGLREKFIYLLCGISVILLMTMYLSYRSVIPIEQSWDEYQTQTVTRQELLLKIQSSFGYGNMIHDFKNFVLRADDKYFSQIMQSNEEIETAINQYRLLSDLTATELQALDNISKVNDLYRKAAIKVRANLKTGESAHTIDKAIRISDKPAIDGFVALKKAYTSQIRSSGNSIRMTISNASTILVIGNAFGALMIIGSVMWIAISLRKRILTLSGLIATAEATKDLTIQISSGSEDEIGQAGNAFNLMLLRFKEVVSTIKSTSNQLYTKTQSLNHSSEQALITNQAQKNETQLVSSAMAEMASSIHEVASNAQDASQATQLAEREVKLSADIHSNAIISIKSLNNEITIASAVIEQLQAISDEVEQVVGVIGDIAAQTNLLALNAAIEASRAGESGRGFAVVADEVRNLAQKTQQSTSKIGHTLTELQQRANEAVTVMNSSSQQSTSSIEQMQQAETALQTVSNSISHISGLNLQIASVAEQQSKVATTININTQSIIQTVDEANNNNQLVSTSAEDIDHLMGNLLRMVSEFKV